MATERNAAQQIADALTNPLSTISPFAGGNFLRITMWDNSMLEIPLEPKYTYHAMSSQVLADHWHPGAVRIIAR